jgi:L,D-peptidoglycan transpeptidase YkuD (ErfK/YbiS/YcfS/YnhG family)
VPVPRRLVVALLTTCVACGATDEPDEVAVPPSRTAAAAEDTSAPPSTAAPMVTPGFAAAPSVAEVANTVAAAIPEVAPPSLDTAARVTTTAARDIDFDINATCDIATAEALAARHPDVRQFVLVKTTSFTVSSGTVEVVGRSVDGTWRCQRAAQFARLGRNGTRVLADRRSGDGTTPAGVFPLGSVTAWDGQTFQFFGNSPDPGVRGTYRDVRREDCWGATPNTARYQHVVNLPQCPGPDDEWLAGVGAAYSNAAIIGANLDPISGDAPGETPFAAAIFLHRHSYAADGSTRGLSGCVSLSQADLEHTLRTIDPALNPQFAIGPADYLLTTA